MIILRKIWHYGMTKASLNEALVNDMCDVIKMRLKGRDGRRSGKGNP